MTILEIDSPILNAWHEQGKHEKIIQATSSLTLDSWKQDLNMLELFFPRIKALLMMDRLQEALELIAAIQDILTVIEKHHQDDERRSRVKEWSQEAVLLEVEALMRQGSHVRALDLLDALQEELSFFHQKQALYLRSTIFWRLGRLDEASRILQELILVLDDDETRKYLLALCHHRLGNVFHRKGMLDEALKWLQEAMRIFQDLDNQFMIASCLNSIGSIFYAQGVIKEAEQQYERALQAARSLKSRYLQALILNNMGLVCWNLGRLDEALSYFRQSYDTWKKKRNIQRMAISLDNMGLIYRHQGDLERALDCQEESLRLKQEIGNQEDIAVVLKNIGMTHHEAGNDELAITYLKKSLKILETLDNPIRLSEITFYLLIVACDRPEIIEESERQHHLELLRDCSRRDTKNVIMNARHRLAQALIQYKVRKDKLTRLPRKTRIHVEHVLTALIEDKPADQEIAFHALITLIAFYFEELRYLPEPELFTCLDELLKQLIQLGEQQQSMLIKAQALWLQANFELVNGRIESARQIFVLAERIAERWGLNRLAMAISRDHDELLEKLERLTANSLNNLSIPERLNLTRVDGLIKFVSRRQVPKVDDEAFSIEPIMFLMMGRNGVLLHHESFSDEVKGNPHLVSGFISAIHSFSHELFSSGVDRLKVGSHGIVIVSHGNAVLLALVFKGNSFEAAKKIRTLKQELQVNQSLSQEIERCMTWGKALPLETRKLLGNLASKLFSG